MKSQTWYSAHVNRTVSGSFIETQLGDLVEDIGHLLEDMAHAKKYWTDDIFEDNEDSKEKETEVLNLDELLKQAFHVDSNIVPVTDDMEFVGTISNTSVHDIHLYVKNGMILAYDEKKI